MIETNKTKAGASQVDITPPLGTLVNGDFITHYAVHVHDPLFAKALVIQDAHTTIAICVVDICAMSRLLLDEVKLKVFEQTGILPQNMMISSTHTHAAGSVESLLGGHADLPYRQKLPGLIVRAIVQAQQNVQQVTIGFGSLDVPEYILCRRYAMKAGYEAKNPVTGSLDTVKTNPFGDENQIVAPVAQMDTELCYIAIKNEQNEWVSIVANYSLHYVGDWPNGTISADYFGVFSSQLKSKLHAHEHFVGIMSNGTSGEANIWDFANPTRFTKTDFEKSRLIGSDLAEKMVQSLDNINWQSESPLTVMYEELPVAVRKPDAAELAAAKAIVAVTRYESLDTTNYYDTVNKIYAREQVLLNEYPGVKHLPLQAFKIGDIVIGALGGEFFAETGIALKSRASGYHYFTITLANDYVGYVCPELEIARGGYETWRCRTSCLDVKAEHEVRERLSAIIAQL